MKERIVFTGAVKLLPQPVVAANHCRENTSVIRFTDDEELLALSHQSKRQTLLSMLLNQQCERLFQQAGLGIDDIRGTDTGLVSGSYYGCMSTTQNISDALWQKGPRGVDVIEFAKATHSFPLSAASIEFTLLGPTAAVVSGEFAGLDALMMANDWLLSGRCQRVIVVGYEHFSPLLEEHLREITGEEQAGLYSDNLSILLLETYSSAVARQASVMAELLQVIRLGGSLATLPARWQKIAASWPQGDAAINVLTNHSPHPGARQLEEEVLGGYSAGFRRHSVQDLPQALGACPLLQLAHFFLSSPDIKGEYLLHHFTANGAAGVRFNLGQSGETYAI
ncbi:hypothetical protein FEM41_11905 [Jejubacter calystegiae]|uniref:Beta-ketoacyl synthase-like N-terminal domain-containing protein n=1 Tax=Jejubacter calystegiae TaxID=2579935 RepID=A0A4P8YNW1_9ENTR|nr:beta-ketoacyl synthase N-terminal-like domain-containing protein [Jejubacter calystegiae]QCT20302.1 hypothetical protein FEM41_11905 [Jejubacter calystegiae]